MLLFSIITLLSGCENLDGGYNHLGFEKELPACIVTTSGPADNLNTTFQFFKYDSYNRIVEIESVSSYDSTLSVISYENGNIKVERIYSGKPDVIETSIYKHGGSNVFIEIDGQPSLSTISINDVFQVTSYANPIWSHCKEMRFTYDKNGNISSYAYIPGDNTNTLVYGDKKGVFRNGNTPSWFLVTQIGDIAIQSLYNNCSSISKQGAVYKYNSTYNSTDYPTKIENITDDFSISYNIYYNTDMEIPEVPVLPAEPVDPVLYDLSASITINDFTGNVFIGKAIKSFNTETKEIIFHNILANLCELTPVQLNIYKGEELLMSAAVISSDKPHQTVNDLVFLIDVDKNESFYFPDNFKYYFLDGYPALDKLTGNKEEAEQARIANAQQRQDNWDSFLNYLTETDKILKQSDKSD